MGQKASSGATQATEHGKEKTSGLYSTIDDAYNKTHDQAADTLASVKDTLLGKVQKLVKVFADGRCKSVFHKVSIQVSKPVLALSSRQG